MWLFTDLDGTLIPLDASPQNVSDLQELKRFLPKHGIGLVFVTGRHLQSTCQAIEEFALPDPEWIICDVGTTVIDASSSELVPDPDYMNELANRTGGWNAERLVGELKLPRSVRLQETEKQANFKISFYANASELPDIVSEFKQQLKNADAPYGIISSVDPFTGDGLIDFLPAGVDKAFAARWLAEQIGVNFEQQVIYAGDSGNDFAALTSGCRSILVGNADRSIESQIKTLPVAGNVFCSAQTATSAVLEGVRRFHVLDAAGRSDC